MKSGGGGLFNKIILSFIVLTSNAFSQDKGLNHYQNQDFRAAQDYYESVLQKRENQAEAHFGRGSSAFQQGDLETAKQAFEQSLNSNDNQLKSKAMYNLGNTFYQNQKTEEALAFYRKALELDPNDKEAKFNYEFLKYQQKPPEDQQQQEQDQSQEDQENENQENKEEKEDQEEKQDENKEQEKKEQEKEEKEEKDQEPNQEQQEQQQPQPQEASEEEKSQDLKQAESILDALKQDEKIMQKRQIARAKSRKLAKDW
ncbi:MAG: tetratricopeptide repeat protein [Candidatus Marinimicrobia bacterium]|jgi:tetratricopeptide (TPR) repeat protein|nr:tetratricopeptide repeat protein [Candidatus Neomarinimicrobiota bacterium]MDP6612135.1 tetratricopeptide repeat protein [Candidatus Neomarinimicrobiota bacterium]|tara:strand:- start:6527 stop:7297 length:771 start_codon:yes stop_codon:yes gene_type:complete